MEQVVGLDERRTLILERFNEFRQDELVWERGQSLDVGVFLPMVASKIVWICKGQVRFNEVYTDLLKLYSEQTELKAYLSLLQKYVKEKLGITRAVFDSIIRGFIFDRVKTLMKAGSMWRFYICPVEVFDEVVIDVGKEDVISCFRKGQVKRSHFEFLKRLNAWYIGYYSDGGLIGRVFGVQNQDYWVLFNVYGDVRALYDVVVVFAYGLTERTGIKYTCFVTAIDDVMFHFNNSQVALVFPLSQRFDEVFDLSSMLASVRAECEVCGKFIALIDKFYHMGQEDKLICFDCLVYEVVECDKCKNIILRSEAYKTVEGTLCRKCYENLLVKCYGCEKKLFYREAKMVIGGWVCEECFKRFVFRCEFCDEDFTDDYLVVMKFRNGVKNICLYCACRIFNIYNKSELEERIYYEGREIDCDLTIEQAIRRVKVID